MQEKENSSAELVVAESMQLKDGGFYADFDAMKVAAKNIVSDFEAMEIVTEEDRKIAKGIRAQLNKYIKEVNQSRIALEKTFDIPKIKFRESCSEIIKIFEEAASQIDDGIKKKDQEFEKARLNALADEYDAYAPDLVELIPLDTLIAREPKLKGRTCPESKAISVLDAMLADIVKNRDILLSQNLEYVTEADACFCQTLDLSKALNRNSELIAEREAKEEHERAVKEMEETRAQRAVSTPAHAAPPKVAKVDVPSRWSFEFEGTRHQAEAIADFARAMGIKSEGIKKVQGDI